MASDHEVFYRGKRIPEYIGWIVTKRCNLKCPHCYVAFIQDKELDDDQRFALLTDAINSGLKKIDLTGGEFLLLESSERILEYLAKNDVNITVFTNGLTLTEEKVDFLSSIPVEIIISLDGGKRIHHEAVRGEGSWNRTLKLTSLLRSKGINFSFLMALNRLNFKDTYEYVRLAMDLGAKKACFIPTMRAGRADSEIVLRPFEILQFLRDVENTASSLNFPISLWCMPFSDLFVKSVHVEIEHCRIGEPDIVDLDPMGNLLLCDVLPLKFANVLEKGIVRALVEQSQTEVFRSVFEANPSGPCSDCENWNRCRSGCFARSYLSGDILAPDPLCPNVSGEMLNFSLDFASASG